MCVYAVCPGSWLPKCVYAVCIMVPGYLSMCMQFVCLSWLPKCVYVVCLSVLVPGYLSVYVCSLSVCPGSWLPKCVYVQFVCLWWLPGVYV